MKTFLFLVLTAVVLTTNSQNIIAIRKGGSDTVECEYKGFALNTVFNLPIVRYNINSLNGKSDVLGSLEYFNSLGAGISLSFGKIRVKSESNNTLRNTFSGDKTITMQNAFGISVGVLFSKNDSIGGSRIMFAPNINLQLLDFQVGFGYELGSVANTAHRCFFTVSYGIPLTKLSGTGSYLLSNPRSMSRKAARQAKKSGRIKEVFDLKGVF